MKTFLSQIRAAILLLMSLTLLTGLLYPLAVTGLARAIFPRQANGSLVRIDGEARGSELIGQPFSDPEYFRGRPSVTAPAYNAAASGGSNLGPLNPALLGAVRKNIDSLRALDPQNGAPIPVDLVTASASGLDPHISVAAALYQIPRVARNRGLPESRLRRLVDSCTEGRTFGILGEPRVNVLRLNMSLDVLQSAGEAR